MPGLSSQGIFLSYRRADTPAYARLLQRELTGRFPGSRVFMDLDSIPPGRVVEDVIRDAVDSCAVFVALIGRQWATLADEQGRRRLDSPDDYVRFEVKTALDRGVWVIPVLVDGANPVRQQDLPFDLQRLARLNAFELSDRRYDFDSARLLDDIQRELAAPGAAAVSRTPDAQENPPKKLDELFLLRLIVPGPERVHLENLHAGSNLDYERNASVQAQLRHLRDLGFIRSKRYISDMPEHFNLGEWAELTDEGNEYLRRTAEVELPTQISRSQSVNPENAQENPPKKLDELFLLRLIVPGPERVHLENLHAGSNLHYVRNASVQAQLRHLRDLGFIRSKRYISDMPEHFNLGEWAELTDDGEEYLRHTAQQTY